MELVDSRGRFGLLGLLVFLPLAGCYVSHRVERESVDAGVVEEPEECEVSNGFFDGGPVSGSCAVAAPMVAIELRSGSYLIESTEVTEEAYASFLRCSPDARSPDPSCAGVTDFVPCERVDFDPSAPTRLPVRCISWCAASAYCEWAGRRLCRRAELGQACEATTPRLTDSLDPRRVVVTEPHVCNLSAYETGRWGSSMRGPIEVGSARDCRGYCPTFGDVRDVVGNVDEWVEECTPDGYCSSLNSSWNSGPNQPCAEFGRNPRVENSVYDLGFRCCADLSD